MRPRLIHLILLSPVNLLLILIIGLPSIYVLWLSLHETSFGQEPTFVGMANYYRVLSDRYFGRAFLNTFVVVNVVVYVELLVAIGMACLFASGIPMRRLMISLVIAPYAASEVVAVVIWKYMFEPDIGLISALIATIQLPELAWTTDRWAALGLIGLLSVWMNLPFSFLILYAARLGLPKDLYESAKMDGANVWKQFWYVTLPMMLPAILVALMFRYVFAFRLFSEVWLLTKGGPARQTEVLGTYLYRHAFSYQEFGMASAIGWLMVLATLMIASGYLRAMYHKMLTSNG
jgi:multiple sugar transport system permease protein